MADSSAQNQVHAWIAETWLSRKLGISFERQRVKLTPGGSYTFPAVSGDPAIVATIHTSSATGKSSVNKLNKVRSDFYFLLLARTERRVAVFTDRSMFSEFSKEQREGRVPKEIELLLVENLPSELAAALAASQQVASAEVTPG